MKTFTIANTVPESAWKQQLSSVRLQTYPHLAEKLSNSIKEPGTKYKYLHGPTDMEIVGYHQGFLQLISKAYSRHLKLEVSPHDFWFIIMCELKNIIHANSEMCRPMFSTSKEKIEISVEYIHPASLPLELVVAHLERLMPIDINLFLPEMSTSTISSAVATVAVLCDAVQAYYSYSTYCCGIPEIRVMGTQADWMNMLDCITEIAGEFSKVKCDQGTLYCATVATLLHDIIKSLFHPESEQDAIDFWTSIFTSKNVGSGGELIISGWITKLYANARKLESEGALKLENLSASYGVVPYTNKSTNTDYKAVYGAFCIMATPDDFVKTDYAGFIFEKVDIPKK